MRKLLRARLRLSEWIPLAAALLIGAAGVASAQLYVKGMTFVGSRGSVSELVLHSDTAVFHPETDIAELEVVTVVVTQAEKGQSFEMTCDRARLNVETNDFVAEGNVHGVTADGQRYSAPTVEYDHANGILSSEERVVMVDDSGSFEGDGFRYHVRDQRFSLLGNVRVVQTP
jgi:LPS export ABC transporter protein LptC